MPTPMASSTSRTSSGSTSWSAATACCTCGARRCCSSPGPTTAAASARAGPWLEGCGGQRWRGQRVAVVAGDEREAVAAAGGDGGLPGRAGLDDVFVGAADEVPPHDELFGEGFAAEQQAAHSVVGGNQVDRLAAGAEVGEFTEAGGQVADREGTLDDQYGVLV